MRKTRLNTTCEPNTKTKPTVDSVGAIPTVGLGCQPVTEYTTIRVRQDAKDKAEQHKQADESWSDYLLRCTSNPPEVIEYVNKDVVDSATGATTDADKIARKVWENADYTELEARIKRVVEEAQR